jgi:hypothetical protein
MLTRLFWIAALACIACAPAIVAETAPLKLILDESSFPAPSYTLLQHTAGQVTQIIEQLIPGPGPIAAGVFCFAFHYTNAFAGEPESRDNPALTFVPLNWLNGAACRAPPAYILCG